MFFGSFQTELARTCSERSSDTEHRVESCLVGSNSQGQQRASNWAPQTPQANNNSQPTNPLQPNPQTLSNPHPPHPYPSQPPANFPTFQIPSIFPRTSLPHHHQPADPAPEPWKTICSAAPSLFHQDSGSQTSGQPPFAAAARIPPGKLMQGFCPPGARAHPSHPTRGGPGFSGAARHQCQTRTHTHIQTTKATRWKDRWKVAGPVALLARPPCPPTIRPPTWQQGFLES